MPLRSSVWLRVLAISACGCSDPGRLAPSSPLNVEVAAPRSTVAPPAPATFSIVSVAPVPSFVLDGELSEWGRLAPLPNVEEVVAPDVFPRTGPLGQGDIPEEIVNAPNPADANLRIGVMVTSTGLRVAIDFGTTGLDAVTLGLASLPPRSASLAYVQGEGDTSEPAPPEPIRMIAAPSDAAFTSQLRLSRAGVERLDAEGHAASLSDASVKVNAQRHTLEATLPSTALPELVEAPLAYLRMAAVARGPIATDTRQPPWRWVELAEPVAFEPNAALREKVMTLVQLEGPAGGAGLSYHPSEPNRIASVDRSPSGFGPLQPMGVLFEKRASLGDVDVGLGFACAPFVVTMKAGRFHDVSLLTYDRPPEDEGSKQGTLSDGIVRGIVERDGELHVIAFAQSAMHTQITGEVIPAHWSITRVDRAGALRSERCEPELDDWNTRYQIGAGHAEPFADEGFTKFGWHLRDGRKATFECRWDGRAKSYEAKLSLARPR